MNKLGGSTLLIVLFMLFSVPACIIDIRTNRIPDSSVFSGITVLFILRLFIVGDPIKRMLLEIVSGPLIFFGIRCFTKGKLGIGDIKFAAMMAVFIGFPGWFIATGLAAAFGLVFSLAGLLLGFMNKTSKLPFAPFLTAGSIGAYILYYFFLL